MYVLDTYQQYYCILRFIINNRIKLQRKEKEKENEGKKRRDERVNENRDHE